MWLLLAQMPFNLRLLRTWAGFVFCVAQPSSKVKIPDRDTKELVAKLIDTDVRLNALLKGLTEPDGQV